jgi:hypothetical protein
MRWPGLITSKVNLISESIFSRTVAIMSNERMNEVPVEIKRSQTKTGGESSKFSVLE